MIYKNTKQSKKIHKTFQTHLTMVFKASLISLWQLQKYVLKNFTALKKIDNIENCFLYVVIPKLPKSSLVLLTFKQKMATEKHF